MTSRPGQLTSRARPVAASELLRGAGNPASAADSPTARDDLLHRPPSAPARDGAAQPGSAHPRAQAPAARGRLDGAVELPGGRAQVLAERVVRSGHQLAQRGHVPGAEPPDRRVDPRALGEPRGGRTGRPPGRRTRPAWPAAPGSPWPGWCPAPQRPGPAPAAARAGHRPRRGGGRRCPAAAGTGPRRRGRGGRAWPRPGVAPSTSAVPGRPSRAVSSPAVQGRASGRPSSSRARRTAQRSAARDPSPAPAGKSRSVSRSTRPSPAMRTAARAYRSTAIPSVGPRSPPSSVAGAGAAATTAGSAPKRIANSAASRPARRSRPSPAVRTVAPQPRSARVNGCGRGLEERRGEQRAGGHPGGASMTGELPPRIRMIVLI